VSTEPDVGPLPEQLAAREVDIALRDGSTVGVRPIRRDDEAAVLDFLRGLSDDSRALRFFSAASDLGADARRSVDVDYADSYGIVASAGAEGVVVGHANYVRSSPGTAEIAFAIADSYQGRGLATILLAHLADAGQESGIDTFTATVLPRNHKMIEVFRESGFPVDVRADVEGISFELPTSLTDEGRERFEDRDRVAAVAAVRSVLAPRAVAVVGASRRRGTVGGEILHNLLEGGFRGVVYPVNASASAVQAIRAYPSVSAAPGPVDLAVIAVPAAAVVDVARDCAQAGVNALVVISAGFAETGPEGTDRQRELLGVCRAAGMRLVGPNCLGVLCTAADVRLNATFMPRAALAGHVAFLSQSGGLGIAIVDAATTLGLGLSAFASIGNKADLSGNDFVQYWEQDPDTAAILLYLESFGNARKFARIARRVGRSKPIVAVKGGRSAAGARATSSHTGALVAASDVTVDALFRQAGVVRTDTLAELFDVAALLGSQPPPAGERVAIVTNGGGPGILCADACAATGLKVVDLPDELRARLGAFLPVEASLQDPVDMIATASADDYRSAIGAVADAEIADTIIAIFVPPLVTQASDVALAVRDAADALPAGVTLVSVFMSEHQPPPELERDGARVPAYTFPENAARAVAHAAQYGRWRTAPEGEVPLLPGCRPDEAAAVIAESLAEGAGWLSPERTWRLLSCYGLPLARTESTADAEQAARAAVRLGGEVALKVVAPDLLHKTEAGAVRLGLHGEQDVRRAAAEAAEAARAAGHEPAGFVVQEMAPAGVELLVGVVADRTFGPVLACGAGGVRTELLRDVAVRITPLTDLDPREMLRSLRTFPLLEGYRGAPPCDIEAIEDTLLRVSALVEAHPEVIELDCNPLIALAQGALIVDARVRIELPPPRRPAPSLDSSTSRGAATRKTLGDRR
jgi:acetyl coenzyme A synthetase (ADP forming)-like protein